MSNEGPVLVVGGTGMLGGKVVSALQANGKKVRALVRPVALRPGAFLDQVARIGVRSIPAGLLRAAGKVLGPAVPLARDISAMIDWFQTGKYVADTTRQQEVFGPPPTAEDAVARLLTGLGHAVRK
jgi:NAD(P)-dependent dehydrogenase (short-subunit alcohol dehydrogenase family)